MSILEPAQGEVFSIRTYKSYEGYRWANTYEIQCTSEDAVYSDLTTAAMAIAIAEKRPLAMYARIYKVTISTYIPDSQPYNPDSFTTLNVNMGGDVSAQLHELLPLQICVFVRRNTLTGRPGKSFYRAFLFEGNVTYGGDRFEISQERMNAIANPLQTMLSGVGPKFRLVLARGTPEPENIRPVVGLTVVNRTSTKKLDNRYFDVRD